MLHFKTKPGKTCVKHILFFIWPSVYAIRLKPYDIKMNVVSRKIKAHIRTYQLLFPAFKTKSKQQHIMCLKHT